MIGALQDWYVAQCDGDWEHAFGVTILTMDNPGWSVLIDLDDTEAEGMRLSETRPRNASPESGSSDDWYELWVEEGRRFRAFCSPQRLEFVLERFLEAARLMGGMA